MMRPNHFIYALIAASLSIPFSSVQAINTSQAPVRAADGEGGVSTGGGDSAQNAAGGRSLLDLLETDELRYFDLQMGSFDWNLNSHYTDLVRGYTDRLGIAERRYMHEILGIPDDFVDVLAVCTGNDADLKETLRKSTNTHGKDYGIGGANPRIRYGIRPLRWAFVKTQLQDLQDEGAIRVENPRTRRQLAIQTDDLVIVNEAEFNSLDNTSKAALKLHEGVICALKAMNPAILRVRGTEPVRFFVRQFSNWVKDRVANPRLATPTPASAVATAYNSFAIPELRRVDDAATLRPEPRSFIREFYHVSISARPGERPHVVLERFGSSLKIRMPIDENGIFPQGDDYLGYGDLAIQQLNERLQPHRPALRRAWNQLMNP